mgnify:CR=1 FL=1
MPEGTKGKYQIIFIQKQKCHRRIQSVKTIIYLLNIFYDDCRSHEF